MNLSKFDLSHEFKGSTEFGLLKPFLYLDCVPGDKHRLSYRFLARFEPLVVPIIQDISVYFRYYFVPYRLLTKNFEKALTNPEDLVPLPMLSDYVNTSIITTENNLLRAFGINSSKGEITAEQLKNISAFPFQAYYLIYNYFYRDRLLDPQYRDHFEPSDFKLLNSLIDVQIVNYPYDYFQRAYKDAQIGSETNLDINSDGTIKVNEMRFATKLQELKERLILSLQRRNGNKYVSYLKEFFGTSPNSALMDIPYYIGGDSDHVSIVDIESTNADSVTPLGTQAGKAYAASGSEPYFEFDCHEHGCIMGLFYFLPKSSYSMGVPREMQKRYYTDFYNPLFANLGLQEINKMELDAAAPQASTFGYTLRFGELRDKPSVITGNLQSENFWHLGRDLRSETLSDSFRKVNYYNLNRIFAYPGNKVHTNKTKPFPTRSQVSVGTGFIQRLDEFRAYFFSPYIHHSSSDLTDYDRFTVRISPAMTLVGKQDTIGYNISNTFSFFMDLLHNHSVLKGEKVQVFYPIVPHYIGGYFNFLSTAGDVYYAQIARGNYDKWVQSSPELGVSNFRELSNKIYTENLESKTMIEAGYVRISEEHLYNWLLDHFEFWLPQDLHPNYTETGTISFNSAIGEVDNSSGSLLAKIIDPFQEVMVEVNAYTGFSQKYKFNTYHFSLPGLGSNLGSANYYDYSLLNLVKNELIISESRDHIKIAMNNNISSLRPIPLHYNPSL